MRRSWLIWEGKRRRAAERTNEVWLAELDFGRLGVEEGGEEFGCTRNVTGRVFIAGVVTLDYGREFLSSLTLAA
jgi:hypothetical protein